MAQIKFELPQCQIQSIEQTPSGIWIVAWSTTTAEHCPDCGYVSRRVHSYYTRYLNDLPVGETNLQIQIRVKRFRCLQDHCKRQTFSEPLSQLTQPFSRQTKRVSNLIWHLGQALGGQAGARLSSHLRIPTSRYRILRLLRKQFLPPAGIIRVLGVDDWAKKRGQSYGTILVDLERHCVVDLLPDREAQTLAEWLKTQPQIEIVTRDRSLEYANGIRQAAPQVIQVADRWHLLRNLTEVLERALREKWAGLKSGEIRSPNSSSVKRLPFPRSGADANRQHFTREKRIQTYTRVQFLKHKGLSQRRIARLLNLSRATVRRFYDASRYPDRDQAIRPSILDPFIDYLKMRMQLGKATAHQLWQELVERGYLGSKSQIVKWLSQYRQQASEIPKPANDSLTLPSRDTCLRLLTAKPETLSTGDHYLLKTLLNFDVLQTLHGLAQDFASMLRKRETQALDGWLNRCMTSGIKACHHFAQSLLQDYEAVRAAVSLFWSNGQTEGHVHRLKLLKRQMYGRANLDLLRIRLCYKSD